STMSATLFWLIVVFMLFVWFKGLKIKHPPLPPGPPADPTIGHLRKIPTENQETTFYEWSKIYGDVIHLRIPGRSIIVLNSKQAAIELLEKRSANYSDRPNFVVYEIMGWVPTLTFIRYGKQFQKHRRLLQQYLSRDKCVSYQPIQTRETLRLLRSLLTSPEQYDHHFSSFATAITMQIAYGHQINTDEDPYVEITKDVGYAISNSGPPGSTLVDLFPFLQYLPSCFPGTHYANQARRYRGAIRQLHEFPFEETKRRMVSSNEGISKTSYLLYHLNRLNRQGLSDSPIEVDDVKGTAGVIYSAGAETTWSSLSVFLLAMILHPECQLKAQEEIDAVIGSDRLLEFRDRPSLPYVEACLQESYRWHSAVPLGIPHRSLEDDIYKGMFIPKNSLIIPNSHGISLDETVYEDPSAFNPSRYLPRPLGREEPYPVSQFGFGRRICPGRYLADPSLWIATASILATFSISNAIGKDNQPIIPEIAFISGLTSHPKPFGCVLKPRNESTYSLVMENGSVDCEA
ncbi:cytochrome P450, partial [Crucibulum laeve]